MRQHHKLTAKYERKFFDAGGGPWFHNTTGEMLYVEVNFYPKITLWIGEGKDRRKITREEIEKDYRRLRL